MKVYILKGDDVQVDSNTTSIDIPKSVPNNSYKIDGKDQPLTLISFFEADEENLAKNNFENFLKSSKVSLDAKTIFDKYIENHKITFGGQVTPPEMPTKAIWVDSIEKPEGVTLNTDKTEITLDLTKITDASKSWYTLNSSSTKQNVIDAIVKSNKLTDTFKNLLTNKDSFNDFPVTQTPDDSKNNITFTIKPVKTTKENNSQPDLKIIVTYSAKQAQ